MNFFSISGVHWEIAQHTNTRVCTQSLCNGKGYELSLQMLVETMSKDNLPCLRTGPATGHTVAATAPTVAIVVVAGPLLLPLATVEVGK